MFGTFLVVQWLRLWVSSARGTLSLIPHAEQHSQKKKKKLCLTRGFQTSDSLASGLMNCWRSSVALLDVTPEAEERKEEVENLCSFSIKVVSEPPGAWKHRIWFFIANEIMGLFKGEIKRSKLVRAITLRFIWGKTWRSWVLSPLLTAG